MGGGFSVPLNELISDNYLGNLNDFTLSIPYPNKYDDFEEKDKIWIPAGSTNSKRYLRIGAIPNKQKVIERLKMELEDIEDRIACLQRDLKLRV